MFVFNNYYNNEQVIATNTSNSHTSKCNLINYVSLLCRRRLALQVHQLDQHLQKCLG